MPLAFFPLTEIAASRTLISHSASQQEPDMFTVEDAFEASSDRDPILVSRAWAETQARRHGVAMGDLTAELGDRAEYDAAEVLGWLGY